jgi:hypothetical protein
MIAESATRESRTLVPRRAKARSKITTAKKSYPVSTNDLAPRIGGYWSKNLKNLAFSTVSSLKGAGNISR